MLKEALIFAVSLPFLALSEKQRQAVRERDGNKCNAPFAHRCHGPLNVHHIQPQGWEMHQQIPEEVRDRPGNLLTLCETGHKMVHPDEVEFRIEYRQHPNNGAREKIMKRREHLASQGKPYWFQGWDEEMQRKAIENTNNARHNGWKYPPKNGNH